MTSDPTAKFAQVLARGWDELDFTRASERDANVGPLPCGCSRVEVLDLGHACRLVTPQASNADVPTRRAPRLRRSGSPWFLRVHTWAGDVQTPSHTVSNREVPADSEHHCGLLLSQAEFDELVVGRWLHVEQMDNSTWWMNIGGVTVHVTADREGRPRRVRVDGPGDYDEPREGCEYEIQWTKEQNG